MFGLLYVFPWVYWAFIEMHCGMPDVCCAVFPVTLGNVVLVAQGTDG